MRGRGCGGVAFISLLGLTLVTAEPELTTQQDVPSTPAVFDPSTRGNMMYGDPCSTVQECGFPDSVCDEVDKTCRCHPDTPVSNHLDKCGKHPSTRGNMMYGDPCSTVQECGFPDSVCDEVDKTCRCHPDTPVSNHLDKCGKPAGINETCMFNEQCEDVIIKTECKNERCFCRYEMIAEVSADGSILCVPEKQIEPSTKTLDPAMIGVLVGMALMFIIICVVLQLFSRARWRENRSIFNTPNPRLMNVSLLKESKLHAGDRRGSRVSMRPPSRQASQQELRVHSPGPGSRRGSRTSSGHSATSLRSATLRSPTAPGPTSVTVEIRAPDN